MGIRALGLAGVMVLCTNAALAEVEKSIATCAAIPNGLARLACFDALAKRLDLAGPTRKSSELGRWSVREDTSKIDDSTNVFIFTEADNTIRKYGQATRPELWLACRENVTSLWVHAGIFISTQTIEATYRIDRQPAERRTFSISTNYEAFGLWSGRSAIPFIKRLFGRERLLFEVTPHGENSQIIEFQIHGLAQAIAPLSKACHW